MVIRAAAQPGDLGWVVMAHGEVYAEQFGWNTDFEALVLRIVADYAVTHGPRERGWIAEVDGQRAGCVFLVDDEQPGTARLRILLVTPGARGSGLGTRLVEQCVAHAWEVGYERVTLWTNDVLVAARRIYRSFGFTLVDENPHHSFGHDLIGQTWTVGLPAERSELPDEGDQEEHSEAVEQQRDRQDPAAPGNVRPEPAHDQRGEAGQSEHHAGEHRQEHQAEHGVDGPGPGQRGAAPRARPDRAAVGQAVQKDHPDLVEGREQRREQAEYRHGQYQQGRPDELPA
jgi:GNAT superfamily N-acetyltransferase